mmetsp:Transcript_36353/g.98425  ORF Transcript_36353/g.98425 Transcript_36353/m.98425 type:complete len:263 (-) Transcript_36353:381-1169(-)
MRDERLAGRAEVQGLGGQRDLQGAAPGDAAAHAEVVRRGRRGDSQGGAAGAELHRGGAGGLQLRHSAPAPGDVRRDDVRVRHGRRERSLRRGRAPDRGVRDRRGRQEGGLPLRPLLRERREGPDRDAGARELAPPPGGHRRRAARALRARGVPGHGPEQAAGGAQERRQLLLLRRGRGPRPRRPRRAAPELRERGLRLRAVQLRERRAAGRRERLLLLRREVPERRKRRLRRVALPVRPRRKEGGRRRLLLLRGCLAAQPCC